ncbi:DUF7282 domain-containing protein, partial [Halococcus sp. AFM35]|uniref:DUF7282 domain-containing protein n=1 Tax=Halococcus sp. AFM35 TaxID=3421653 RepID=UPI003EB6DB42
FETLLSLHSILSNHRISSRICVREYIGGFLALCGWVATGQIAPSLASGFTTVSGAVTSGATALQSLTPFGATGRIVDLLRSLAGGLAWIGSQLQDLDRQLVAEYGFVIGAGGILVHLLGDVITVSGIRPLLPISSRRVSLSSLRANSTLGNTGLFAGGVVAIAVVLSLTVGGAGIAMPADLSPVGAVDAQGMPGAQNDSGQNTTTPAVEIHNQTSSGGTVTVQRATLSQPGFVAIHTSSYPDDLVGPNESIIAVSQRLAAGTHHSITIDVSNAPPGNAPGLNRSQLNETITLAATVYGDTNDNVRLDSVRSLGENDTLVVQNGSVVRDSARVRVPSPPRRTASVAFRNQTFQNDTLTVAQVRLPRGGFLIAHNESYQRTGDALTSAVAISRYLPPGNHSNVTLSVKQGALDESQTVTIRPSLDTNDNQQYDFVTSDGFQDVAYETVNRSGVITDSAQVRAPGSGRQTSASASSPSTPAAGSETGGLSSSIWLVGIVILGIAGGVILAVHRVR